MSMRIASSGWRTARWCLWARRRSMRNRWLFLLSGVGLAVALLSAYIFAEQPAAQPPAFNPAANPYANGVYAEGIIESLQSQGENINIYPEVTGPITGVRVAEGDRVRKGDTLLT